MELINSVQESQKSHSSPSFETEVELLGLLTRDDISDTFAKQKRKILSKMNTAELLMGSKISDPKKRDLFTLITNKVKQDIVADLNDKYKDFKTYSNFGIGQIAESSMSGINAASKNQSLLMDLDEAVQQQGEDYMSKFLNKMNDIVKKLEKDTDNDAIQQDSSAYNFLSSNMNYISGSYSTEHNQFSNSETNLAQDINMQLQNVQNSSIKAGDILQSILSMF
jgi:hypothetical protein